MDVHNFESVGNNLNNFVPLLSSQLAIGVEEKGRLETDKFILYMMEFISNTFC